MKIYQLIFVDYEQTDTLGIYLSKEKALEDFSKHGVNLKSARCRMIEWEIDKWNGQSFNEWEEEAFMPERDK